MKRRTVAVRFPASLLALVLASVLVLGLAFTSTSAAAGTRPATRYALAAIHATNAQRAAHHLPTLKFDRCLKRLATRQAARMARQRHLSHQSLRAALRTCHLRTVGENVAQGFPSGSAVVNVGWMNSPPHRANILHRGYRLMAITAKKAHGRWWVAQVFGAR
jgi:uncharacterized protein YkwD